MAVPRAGWVKPETNQRLSDHISIGVLTPIFLPELVDRIVEETGRKEVRHRLLPACVVVYYVLGLALFADASYEEVMRNLVEGLLWASGRERAWQVPRKASLFKARARLGPGSPEALYRAVAVPMAKAECPGAFYRGLCLMSIDGTMRDLADTAENAGRFGRPGSGRGEGAGAFPQVRVVGLGACGTHRKKGDIVVRVIEYGIDDPGCSGTQERYRLITTLLDQAQAPTRALAALYTRRWCFETTLGELKTHQRGPSVTLRAARRRPPGALRLPLRPLRHKVVDAHRGARWCRGPRS